MKSLAVKETNTSVARHEKILTMRKTMSIGFLLIGKEMKLQKADDNFQAITGEDSTWKDYCDEVSINQSYANTLIRLYDTFVVKFKFSEEEISKVEHRKLVAILPFVEKAKNKSEVDELIGDAEHLRREDLFLKIHQMSHPPDECMHNPVEVKYWYCNICREKLSEEEVKKCQNI